MSRERLEATGAFPQVADLEAALATCEAAAHPARALDAVTILAGARARRGKVGGGPWVAHAATLAGASRIQARLLGRLPRLVDVLEASPWLDRHKPKARFEAELGRRVAGLDPADDDALARLGRILRRYRRREYARIILRDLTGRDTLLHLTGELSDLASVCLDVGARILHARLVARYGTPPAGEAAGAGASTPGFTILGMGKLGGGELNLSSDIDILCVYGQDGETSGGADGTVTAFQFHARLVEQLARLLSERTEDGFVFRVDLDLRPEGRSGPVTNSLGALESYYETFGRAWERQAWIKALPVAGDPVTGQVALERVAPFVWRRSLDLAAITSISNLKDELDRRTRRADPKGLDLKLGRGGIRTVEFVVQALQLLYGGKDPRLRGRQTLAGLDALLGAGLLDAEDVAGLGSAYDFLRRAEHRIQMLDDRQTHRLPTDAADLSTVARAMDFSDAASFMEALDAHRERVVEVSDRRFPGRAGPEELAPDDARLAADPNAADTERESALAALGFREPDGALAHLRRLSRRPLTPFSKARSERAETLGAWLLVACARSPDPDTALAHLADFLDAVPTTARDAWNELLAAQPASRRLLANVLGTSPTLARDFVRHPELLDVLLMRAHATPTRERRTLLTEIDRRLDALPEDDIEAALGTLRRFRHEEFLRVGLNDIAGALEVDGVSEELSTLAEVLLAGCRRVVTTQARARWGWPEDADGPLPWCVLAFGKLGSREMGYASDLDLVFLYGGASGARTEGGMGAQEFFTRVGQRLISALSLPLPEGTLYEIDTRLRPSGGQGMLVTHLEAFQRYQRENAALWERQALVRARPLAGPAPFLEAVDAARTALIFEGAPPEDLASGIREMRERVTTARARPGPGPDLKTSTGGLVDVEFAAQFLALAHGRDHPSVRGPGTLDILAGALEAGLAPEMPLARLAEGYHYLLRLQNRLHLTRPAAGSQLPVTGPALDALARQLGLYTEAPGQALLDQVEKARAEVRAAYDAVVR